MMSCEVEVRREARALRFLLRSYILGHMNFVYTALEFEKETALYFLVWGSVNILDFANQNGEDD